MPADFMIRSEIKGKVVFVVDGGVVCRITATGKETDAIVTENEE